MLEGDAAWQMVAVGFRVSQIQQPKKKKKKKMFFYKSKLIIIAIET